MAALRRVIRRSRLERKTPLARGTSQLKRTPLARSSKRIPARSQKREAIADERRAFVERILRARPVCEARVPGLGCAQGKRPGRDAVDVHELVRRSQGSPIVPSQGLADDDVLAVCRPCHDWITTHPREAVALGFARWGSRLTEDPPDGA